MSKVIGKLRLAPYVPAWYDMINEIHLVRPHHVSQEVKEGADIEPIMRGVQAGYVIFDEVVEEVDRLLKVGLENMTPTEKAVFQRLATYRQNEEARKEIGMTIESIDNIDVAYELGKKYDVARQKMSDMDGVIDKTIKSMNSIKDVKAFDKLQDDIKKVEDEIQSVVDERQMIKWER